MAVISQQGFNGVLAAIGAAGGVGAFVLLMDGKQNKLAVVLALATLLVGLGIVTFLEAELQGGKA